MIRGGYGMFYNRTILGAIDDVLEFSKFTTSNVVNFPNASADPGPSAGRFPTDPMPGQRPVRQSRAAQPDVPAGRRAVRNAGVVIFDSPDRQQPFAHQATFGYVARADRRRWRSMPTTCTSRTATCSWRATSTRCCAPTPRAPARITRLDAFGVLGEAYTERVWVMENTGVQRLRRAEPLAREALRQQLVGTDVVLAVEVARHREQPGRQEHRSRRWTDLNLDAWDEPVERRSPPHPVASTAAPRFPKTAAPPCRRRSAT